MARSSRFVLTTFGSFGDVLPYLSLGRGLQARGHDVVIAASAVYRHATESAGLAFAPVRPDIDLNDREVYRRAMEPKRGTQYVVPELLCPFIRDSYDDLAAASQRADFLVSHVLTHAAPILAEQTGMPWAASVLSPMIFCSAWDPPAFAPIPGTARLRALGPRVTGWVLGALKRVGRNWGEPIRSLRRELGLKADADPLWEGQFSPHGNVALFSGALAEAQPDWPERTTLCGFPYYDDDFGGDPERERLEEFVGSGSRPLVFTLGSSGGHAAGDFYDIAVRAAQALKRRAVFVVGEARPPDNLSAHVLAVRSTSLAWLFNQACAAVHCGGIGTTALALRAGCPQLIIPLAHDQFDNAARISRSKLGAWLSRRRMTPKRMERELGKLLADPTIAERVVACASQIKKEDGVATACAAFERILSEREPRRGGARHRVSSP